MSLNYPQRSEDDPSCKLAYRPDLDGMRAVAVLAVLLFHAFPEFLPGGFLGVDVFFVLSGFLISSLLFRQIEHGGICFAEFYRRRVRRLFPSLLVVLTSTLCAGWILLLADELKPLGKHIAGGASFVINLLFLEESNYFDHASETKPLLHLWSLSIEEQFYILWPLLLWLCNRILLHLGWVSATVMVLSFGTNLLLGKSDGAFYLPQARFWELLIGALLAHRLRYAKPAAVAGLWQGWMGLLGLLLVLGGFFGCAREHAGLWALLPTLGTALMIAAGPGAWIHRTVLAHPAMVFLGLISYPLYLWHWPLLSFAHILSVDPVAGWVKVSLLLASLILAWITYRQVEIPLRFSSSPRVIFWLVSGMLWIGSLGALMYFGNGFESIAIHNKERIEYRKYFDYTLPDQPYIEREKIGDKYRFDCDFYDKTKKRMGAPTNVPRPSIDPSCYSRLPGRKAVLIWGDSYAQQFYFGLRKHLSDQWDVLQIAATSCGPDPSVAQPSTSNYCAHSNWFAMKTIREVKPEVVLLMQVHGDHLRHSRKFTAELRSAGVKRIIFAGLTPRWSRDLHDIVARKLWYNTPQRTFTGLDPRQFVRNRQLLDSLEQAPDIRSFDVFNLLCNQDGCLVFLGEDRKEGLTTWDAGHLTPLASDYIARNGLAALVAEP
ncbi:MAG: acyltransferase family protein [Myxococcales bacterium]|nr:acyltransferase [Polyangiaceae bacterium]MDW8250680.1 acyltransferase family protein [Myxococcales bacterium]